MKTTDLIVIGGGPAGMIAAAHAAELGLAVTLLEKNPDLGRKLSITGGGRCNVTNATRDRHALVERYGPDGVALHGLFARFSADDMRALLRRFGLETKIEAEERVFPVTDRATDVRDVLIRFMADTRATVRTGVEVARVEADARTGRVGGVRTRAGESLEAGAILIATGGLSHPDTGSTGDGLAWLDSLGVPVRRPDPALVPIRVRERWVHGLQGLALADAAIHVEVLAEAPHRAPPVADRSAWGNARRVVSRRGKLLFTHFGLSGPLVLNAAAEIAGQAATAAIRILVDVVPGRDPGAVDRDLLAALGAAGSRSVRRVLTEWVPERLARTVCAVAGVDGETRAATVSRADRTALARTLTGMPCTFAGLMGQDKAVVSSGGVESGAVDFRTMRVAGWDNLYVSGDLLAFDRRSGGYSLQVCWSSGWVAAEAVAAAARAARSARRSPTRGANLKP